MFRHTPAPSNLNQMAHRLHPRLIAPLPWNRVATRERSLTGHRLWIIPVEAVIIHRQSRRVRAADTSASLRRFLLVTVTAIGNNPGLYRWHRVIPFESVRRRSPLRT